jgi:hypothetical protein
VKRGLVTSLTLLLGAAAEGLSACPACFGQADGPLADASRVGMWLLLAVTVSLQGAFVAFFLYLRRQAARAAARALDEEWSRLQGATGRSATR